MMVKIFIINGLLSQRQSVKIHLIRGYKKHHEQARKTKQAAWDLL